MLSSLLALLLLIGGCASTRPGNETLPEDPGLRRLAATWYDEPAPVDSTAPPLTVIYPRGPWPDTLLVGDRLQGIPPDSLFILGHLRNPRSELSINGFPTAVHPSGSFLAWLPRGEVSTRALSDSTRLRETAVTFRVAEPSHEQPGPFTRTLTFFDTLRPPTSLPGPSLRPDTARLIVTHPRAKLRCGWPGTNVIYPAEGTALVATARDSAARTFWRVPLGGGQVGWIEADQVTVDSAWTPGAARRLHGGALRPSPRVISRVVARDRDREVEITVPLGDKRPVQVERVSDEQLALTVYGAVSWADLIIQPTRSRAVDELRWSQVDSTTWRLTARVDPDWLGGWQWRYDGGTLLWTVRELPEIDRAAPLRGVRILLDPGHGGVNYSAIGPGGYPEKAANLALASTVTQELERAGAVVLPTRTTDEFIDLGVRVDTAYAWAPDLLLSLHHNALPQGVNPATNHGASVHYVHRHAHPLADALYAAITENGQWPGHGVRYQDLAMARVTICPAVLLEAGFMMQPAEEALIRTEGYRNDMARWLRRGLEAYLASLAEARDLD